MVVVVILAEGGLWLSHCLDYRNYVWLMMKDGAVMVCCPIMKVMRNCDGE